MKYNVIRTYELSKSIIGYVAYERSFVIPSIIRDLPINRIIQYLKDSVKFNNVLAAAKLLNAQNVKNTFNLKFEMIHQPLNIVNQSEWYLQVPLNVPDDCFKMEHIDGRLNLCILFDKDYKHMKFRVNYYLELISKGYTDEEALSLIYS